MASDDNTKTPPSAAAPPDPTVVARESLLPNQQAGFIPPTTVPYDMRGIVGEHKSDRYQHGLQSKRRR